MKKIIHSLLLVSVMLASMPLHALEEKLVIVTSFPKDLTKQFKSAFAKQHPGIKVEMLKKKTTAGIKYIQETAEKNTTDIFWASAPDAFEVLKGDGLLTQYRPAAEGIPDKIGAYPINDPDGYYSGFAAAGYGIMWNTRYLKAKKIPAPAQWSDLTRAIYHKHVGMSAPSRSGTTHLTVETLLQGDGWDKGWAKWKQIAGNFKTVTERSFGVPDGVNSGAFGIGIVIDFFGLSSKGSGFPVDFVYPKTTTLVPANVGIIKQAPHPQAAKAFIDFLLSDEGQTILLDKKIRRLPINPKIYAQAPADFPNPFKDSSIGAAVKFDVQLSKARYNLVNSMFDVMITYRLNDLRTATSAIQKAEAALQGKDNSEASALIEEARTLIAALPISEQQAADPKFTGIFKKKRKKSADKVTGRQAEVEQQWDEIVKANYKKATLKAHKALSLL